MADGVYATIKLTFLSANRVGTIVDTLALDRSSDPGEPVYVTYPATGTTHGETWLARYTQASGAVLNLDLTALAYTFGAASFTKSFLGISVIHFESFDAPGVGNRITIVPPGTNGFLGPWGAGGISLPTGGDILFTNPGDVWAVTSTNKLLTITAPAVAVNFGISIQGTRT
jgi:hypothetical protein